MNDLKKWAIDTIIFDFDGVLVDTGRDIANAANFTLASLGLDQLPPEKIIRFIGGGAEPLIRKCLTDNRSEYFTQALALFKQRYDQYFCVETKLYPGVLEVLQKFDQAQKKMALATNKAERITYKTLQSLDIHPYFPIVMGPESVTHRKPHPESIQRILEQSGTAPHKAVMIGDTAADILAGKAAGTRTCGVTYGFGSLEEIRDANPDIILDEIGQLMEFIR